MPASGMIVNHNIFAINTQRHLGNNNRNLGVSLERLSSGLRINRAADDASGLSLSEGMRAQIGGMMAATRNAEQGSNLIQTAEGALNEVSAMLIRMRELSVQSASSTVNDNNRQAINAEFTQLVAEMDRIAASASYNNTSILRGFGNVVSENIGVSSALVSTATGVTNVTLSGAADGAYLFIDTDPTDNLITLGNGVLSQTIDLGPALDNDSGGGVVATGSTVVANFDRLGIVLNLTGQRNANGANPALDGYRDGNLDGETLLISGGTGGTLQVGANALAVDRIEINIQDMSATGAKLNLSGVSLSTLQSSQSAITTIDLAIDTVTSVRGDLGAQQNRLTYTINNIGVSVENLQSSESIVRDADIAEEVSNFTRGQILVQSSTALLAQANAVPQNALTLLQ
jgi:flagellin